MITALKLQEMIYHSLTTKQGVIAYSEYLQQKDVDVYIHQLLQLQSWNRHK